MPVYGADLLVADRCRHTMNTDKNPFCIKCQMRMYPEWGVHDCTSPPDIARIRHTAGNILSNLHFYRIPAEQQIAALAEALAFTMGSNIAPGDALDIKWSKMKPIIERLMRMESDRIQTKTQADNLVMDVHKPRLKIKKKKGAAHDVETVRSKSRRRDPVKRHRSR